MRSRKYDSLMAERRRKPRNVTLNPVLVSELLAIGKTLGETNLSRLLDEAMRLYVDRHAARSAPKGKK